MKRNTKWILGLGVIVVLFIGIFAFSHKSNGATATSSDGTSLKVIKVGVAPGPYGDIFQNVIGPLLKKYGYTIQVKEFNDYIQPNKALNSGEIDANLFQHTVYLKAFAKANHLDLSSIGIVPTLGMGIYPKKITSLSDLKDKSQVAIPNDPVNLARALQLLAANHIITLKSDINVAKATVDDVATNPKKLVFKPLDAAQLPESLTNVTAALIPGNFSWSAHLNPGDALALENLKEEYKNVIAVQTKNTDAKFAKALKKVITSQTFKDAIAKSKFKDFTKPASWNN